MTIDNNESWDSEDLLELVHLYSGDLKGEDQARFSRYFIAELAERLADGRSDLVEAWAFAIRLSRFCVDRDRSFQVKSDNTVATATGDTNTTTEWKATP